MPLSLRLPAELESQLARYGQHAGLSKSAVIVRSIEEFMARHAQPDAHTLYEQTRPRPQARPQSERDDPRPHKQAFAQAMRRKQAARQAADRTSSC
ncbi:MAG: hypothetical protein Q4G71_10725 [Pseudomonadota bacterium]|nr:hypothetical protein [Pseudomonadota bacterium]